MSFNNPHNVLSDWAWLLALSLIAGIAVSFILAYIFGSLGTYKIMKKRNIQSPFLAWIPIANIFAFGSIYDDIKIKKEKADPNFRLIILIASLLSFATSCYIVVILYIITLKAIFEEYDPTNGAYFILSIIFSIVPLGSFIPYLCLLKVSKSPSKESNI